MTRPEADRDLSAWRASIDAFVQELIDLRNHPAYQRLRMAGDAGKTPLEGETALLAAPVMEAMGRLFQYFELLNQTIRRAEDMRANLPPVFGNGHRLLEIESLLRGQSIQLPPLDAPLEKGTLLGGLDVPCVSPEELLRIMARACEAAKQTVAQVDSVWRELNSHCETAAIDLGMLRGSAGADMTELARAEDVLLKLRASAMSDPLGAAARLERDVRPAIARAQAAIAARAAARRKIEDGLAAGKRRLTELADMHARAGKAYQDRSEKIAGGAAVPLPDAVRIQGLGDWLTRLEAKYASGLFDPILVGLRNWEAAAQDVSRAEHACLDGNRAPLERRSELRGRFDGLKAKSRALGLAENPALMDLGQKADRLLYSSPTAIDDAAAAVASYEAALASGFRAIR